MASTIWQKVIWRVYSMWPSHGSSFSDLVVLKGKELMGITWCNLRKTQIGPWFVIHAFPLSSKSLSLEFASPPAKSARNIAGPQPKTFQVSAAAPSWSEGLKGDRHAVCGRGVGPLNLFRAAGQSGEALRIQRSPWVQTDTGNGPLLFGVVLYRRRSSTE